jgi:predicted RNA methylase
MISETRALTNDDHPADIQFDQYYTREDVAAHFYKIFQDHFDPTMFKIVEPSAGTGSLSRLLPFGSLAFDIRPKHPGIRRADYLTVKIYGSEAIAVIGNPPFGKNASMAVRFFNHAARQARVIALILPRSFKKASIENRIDTAFHLVREEEVPANAFVFRSKPYDVPAIFQIWECRRAPRKLRQVETVHPDFEFTTSDRADFAIQRVGARAGRVHHDFTMSSKSHYFIRGDVEAVMRLLDFSRVTRNVAGNPSLAKSEIVALYCERTALLAGG